VTTAHLLNVELPRYEHHRQPIGIGEPAPRLSWTVTTDIPGWLQRAYEIEISDETGGVVTATGVVESDRSVLVPWPGAVLSSRQRRAVRARVHGRDGSASDWSPWSWAETGLLRSGEWQARATAPPLGLLGEPDGPALLLRREFEARGPVETARLYVTAHGLYEVEINGHVVGDEVMAPGWTSYGHRLRYRTHDVTGLLADGDNAIGATIADGWYRGRVGFRGGKVGVYGDRLALIAQLEIRYRDGTTDLVVTGDGWRCARGPVTAAGLYDGEKHDARLEPAGWSRAGFDDSAWAPADVLDHDPRVLVAPDGPPVRRIETLRPVEVLAGPSGETILDFGQNITGRLRIHPRGSAGHTIRLRHAEVLEDGALSLRPLRDAAALDEYTLRGDGAIETWEPRFTLHGFRYAEVTGWPGALSPDSVEAVVCHTDMRRTGRFTCSDPLLTRLHDNVVWSMRGNFVDIPTDCPQRDERLGWTGDIQIFAPTAAFLYDCAGTLSSWLADLAAEQTAIGTVPHYVPWVPLLFAPVPAAAWGDAAVIVPWVMYERFGDTEVLRRQYPSMRTWVDQVAGLTRDHLWDEGFQFGDWLDPSAPPDRPGRARTDHALVATAYHAWTAKILAETARLLGLPGDAERYEALAAQVRTAFRREFVTPSGRLAGDAQTAYALALRLDLLETADQRARAARRLVELVEKEDFRIGTGFVGTPLICDALCEAGAYDTAYRLLTQQSCPSWLYPVTMGATTVWERWDSLLPDGSVNPGDMTSFNHYALGAVADFLHRTVAGLAPAAPGHRRLRIAPRPGGGLTHASAELDTPYGPASVTWNLTDHTLVVTATIPPGTTAEVDLPGDGCETLEIGAGTHTFTSSSLS
jgi:alpha-L-rhamnosidase